MNGTTPIKRSFGKRKSYCKKKLTAKNDKAAEEKVLKLKFLKFSC